MVSQCEASKQVTGVANDATACFVALVQSRVSCATIFSHTCQNMYERASRYELSLFPMMFRSLLGSEEIFEARQVTQLGQHAHVVQYDHSNCASRSFHWSS